MITFSPFRWTLPSAADIPPFGNEIDYMTFGGIYREVSLRIVPQLYIDNIFAQPKNVMSGNPSLDVNCFLAGIRGKGSISLEAELRDGDKVIAKARRTIGRFLRGRLSYSDPADPTPTPRSMPLRNAKDPVALHRVAHTFPAYTSVGSGSAPHLYGARASDPGRPGYR